MAKIDITSITDIRRRVLDLETGHISEGERLEFMFIPDPGCPVKRTASRCAEIADKYADIPEPFGKLIAEEIRREFDLPSRLT